MERMLRKGIIGSAFDLLELETMELTLQIPQATVHSSVVDEP
jgi:hypothetical protein